MPAGAVSSTARSVSASSGPIPPTQRHLASPTTSSAAATELRTRRDRSARASAKSRECSTSTRLAESFTSRATARRRQRRHPSSTSPCTVWRGCRPTASCTRRFWRSRTAGLCFGGIRTTNRSAERAAKGCRSPTRTRRWCAATCGTTTGLKAQHERAKQMCLGLATTVPIPFSYGDQLPDQASIAP